MPKGKLQTWSPDKKGPFLPSRLHGFLSPRQKWKAKSETATIKGLLLPQQHPTFGGRLPFRFGMCHPSLAIDISNSKRRQERRSMRKSPE